MKTLDILIYPDERLFTVAEPVTEFDEELSDTVLNMLKTMYVNQGIGLAATQVDIHKRILVMDMTPDRTNPRIFINPEIISKSGTQFNAEGCLSVPGVTKRMLRDEIVRVRAFDISGDKFIIEMSGLASVCLQHEMDHLEGKLFI